MTIPQQKAEAMSYPPPPPVYQAPPQPPYVHPPAKKTSAKTWVAIAVALAGVVGFFVVSDAVKKDQNRPKPTTELCQSLRDTSNDVLSPSDWLRLSGLGSGGQLRQYVTLRCPEMLAKVTS